MKKMVITLILESDETTLQGLKDEVISNCARYIISATTNEVEEPKELKCDLFPELSFKLKRQKGDKMKVYVYKKSLNKQRKRERVEVLENVEKVGEQETHFVLITADNQTQCYNKNHYIISVFGW